MILVGSYSVYHNLHIMCIYSQQLLHFRTNPSKQDLKNKPHLKTVG